MRVWTTLRGLLIAFVVALLFAGCDNDATTLSSPSTPAGQVAGFDLSPVFAPYLFLPYVCDDGGPNDTPEQTDLNCFTRADNMANVLGVKWSWDDIDAWTGTGQTGDACPLFDTDGDGLANFALCARITNSPDGSEVIHLPAGESPLIYECSNKKNDRCSKPVTVLQDLGNTYCEVVKDDGVFPDAGDHAPTDVLAACSIDLSVIPGASKTNLLNVCSFPSGEPNSNPFDCVITPGAGYIEVVKTTNPETTSKRFTFSLDPASTNGATTFSRTGPGSILIPVFPDQAYTLVETEIPEGWRMTSAGCLLGASVTGTVAAADGGNGLAGIGVATGLTTTCSFVNSLSPPTVSVTKVAKPTEVPETGGEVEYTVVVQNTSPDEVTLESLADDKFPDLPTRGDCAITEGDSPKRIPAGEAFSCSFTEHLSGNPGKDHTNTVTAEVSNPGGTGRGSAKATVTFDPVDPTLSVTKTPSPTHVLETGEDVTFTVRVENTGAEALTLTSLKDDVYGDLNGQGTCSTTEVAIPVGGSYECTFTRTLAGTTTEDHTNTVEAKAIDDDGTEATGTGSAEVIFDDVPPAITVTKTPSPESVPETGGEVTFTVTVHNDAAEDVTLTSLEDDVFKDLDGVGDCSTGGTIAADGTYTCAFKKTLSGTTTLDHTNFVTATVVDDDLSKATGTDDAVVSFTDVAPTIVVTKTPVPASVPETGGDVTFTVKVLNEAAEDVTLTSLVDDVFGDLNESGECKTGESIPAGETYQCEFKRRLEGTTGKPHENTVKAEVVDDDGSKATGDGTATVAFEDVPPSISVTKTPDPTHVLETGGEVTFTVRVENTAAEPLTLISLEDDVYGDLSGQGNCSTTNIGIPVGESYECTFTKKLVGTTTEDHTNTVTATAEDDDDTRVTGTGTAEVIFDDVQPAITVTKTPSPESVPETGGDVTFSVTVHNDAAEAVRLVSLVDDVFEDLNGVGTCATGDWIVAGGDYTCAFKKTLSGTTTVDHTNFVTATVEDDDSSKATGTDDAVVSFSDVAPTIVVTKTPVPASVPETGGDVTFTVKVLNKAAEDVTLMSLVDDVFDNLDGDGTCKTGESIPAAGTYQCEFTRWLEGTTGTPHKNTVKAVVEDDDGSEGTGEGTATVAFEDVPPTISVTKTPSPSSVSENGGEVTYTIRVSNEASEAVTLTSLTDDRFGDLNGKGDCAVPQTLSPKDDTGSGYSCAFRATLSGDAGGTHVNVVTATASDDDGAEVTDKATATVTFTDALPDISVTKTANPSTLYGTDPGLSGFQADRTFTTTGADAQADDFFFAAPTCDDGGPNDEPAQVDLNCFNRADNLAGELGLQWSWDDVDSWTGTGQTGDACALLDVNGNGNAEYAMCVRITNSADGTQVFQLDSPESPLIYPCSDKRSDRCSQPSDPLVGSALGGTACSVTRGPDGIEGGEDGADTEATCSLDLTLSEFSSASSIELLNVCSFPSGEPNSNPFDCVVQAGAGFLRIVKEASPATATLFGFTLSAPATDGTDAYAVAGGVTSGLIPLSPGDGYTLTETLPDLWQLDEASCTRGSGTATGTFAPSADQVTGISVVTGQTTTCTFSNSWVFTGEVQYTITVSNQTVEPVTLDSLSDDKFSDLGACATGGTILGKSTYECTFTKFLTGGDGYTHTNTVTATASDNETNSASGTGSATVTIKYPGSGP